MAKTKVRQLLENLKHNEVLINTKKKGLYITKDEETDQFYLFKYGKSVGGLHSIEFMESVIKLYHVRSWHYKRIDK